VKGPLKPSTEWRFHLDIMKARPDVGGIVHTHATYSTVLAIAHKEIPACHYMMAAFGGMNVRVATMPGSAQGAVGSCTQGAGGPDRLPACKSRNDRDRRIIGQGDVVGGRTRDHRPAVLSQLGDGGPVLLSEATSKKPQPRSAIMACRNPPAKRPQQRNDHGENDVTGFDDPEMQTAWSRGTARTRPRLWFKAPAATFSLKRDGVMWVKASGTWMMEATSRSI